MFELHCDAILFDLDGVLVDSSAAITRQWQRWAARHGVEMTAIERIWHGRRAIDIMREVAPHVDLIAEARALQEGETNDTEGVIAHAGALALLQALPAQAWAIATSGPRSVATARLRRAGLPIPPVFITGDDVRNGKPHPDPYLLAAQGLGIAPDRCVVIEDAVAGVAAGLAAGAQVIGVTTNHLAHELAAATVVIERLSQLRLAIAPQPQGLLTLTV